MWERIFSFQVPVLLFPPLIFSSFCELAGEAGVSVCTSFILPHSSPRRSRARVCVYVYTCLCRHCLTCPPSFLIAVAVVTFLVWGKWRVRQRRACWNIRMWFCSPLVEKRAYSGVTTGAHKCYSSPGAVGPRRPHSLQAPLGAGWCWGGSVEPSAHITQSLCPFTQGLGASEFLSWGGGF